MAGRKKQKDSFLKVCIILLPLFIVFLSGGYILNDLISPSPTPTPTIHITSDVELGKLKQFLKTNAPITSSSDFYWISSHNIRTHLKGTVFTLSLSNQNRVSNLESTDQVTKDFILYLSQTIERYFVSQGYIKNFYDSPGFNELNEYRQSFSKGDIKCIEIFTAESENYGQVFCGVSAQ